MSKTFGLKDTYINILLAVLIATFFYISLRFDWKLGFVIILLLVAMSVKKIISVPRRVRIAMVCQFLGLLLTTLAATKEIAFYLSYWAMFLIIFGLIISAAATQFIFEYLTTMRHLS